MVLLHLWCSKGVRGNSFSLSQITKFKEGGKLSDGGMLESLSVFPGFISGSDWWFLASGVSLTVMLRWLFQNEENLQLTSRPSPKLCFLTPMSKFKINANSQVCPSWCPFRWLYWITCRWFCFISWYEICTSGKPKDTLFPLTLTWDLLSRNIKTQSWTFSKLLMSLE